MRNVNSQFKINLREKAKADYANAQLEAGARHSFITEMAVFALFLRDGLSV